MAGVVIDTSVLDNILSKLDVNAGAVVQKLAQDTEVYMKTHMSTSSPSLPGEPPAIDTSTLVNSIDAIPESEKVWLTVVGAHYGVDLEFGTMHMQARPFFRPAIEWVANNLPDELIRAVVTP